LGIGEHEGGADGGGHGVVRAANGTPDDLVKEEVVDSVF